MRLLPETGVWVHLRLQVLLFVDSFVITTRNVEADAEAGSITGGSGPFSVESEAEARKIYRFRFRFRFHIGYSTRRVTRQ